MARRKSKPIDAALRAARSAELRPRKDPHPDWLPADGVWPDGLVDVEPTALTLASLPTGSSESGWRKLITAISNEAGLHVEHISRPGATPVLLLNALGVSLEMWDAQIEPLAERRGVIRFDARGHGKSNFWWAG